MEDEARRRFPDDANVLIFAALALLTPVDQTYWDSKKMLNPNVETILSDLSNVSKKAPSF